MQVEYNVIRYNVLYYYIVILPWPCDGDVGPGLYRLDKYV